MSIYDSPVTKLGGDPADLHDLEDQALLIVNVASRCGLTPQYAALQRLHERYAGRGLRVLGFPCNQFGGQEPGSAEEIRSFCDTNYGVTFPLFDKIDVNGEHRHPLYTSLTEVPDVEGQTGDIAWNFEKFVVAPGATTIRRFRPPVDPEADEVVEAIEAVLPG